jgi:hypothetical protein
MFKFPQLSQGCLFIAHLLESEFKHSPSWFTAAKSNTDIPSPLTWLSVSIEARGQSHVGFLCYHGIKLWSWLTDWDMAPVKAYTLQWLSNTALVAEPAPALGWWQCSRPRQSVSTLTHTAPSLESSKDNTFVFRGRRARSLPVVPTLNLWTRLCFDTANYSEISKTVLNRGEKQQVTANTAEQGRCSRAPVLHPTQWPGSLGYKVSKQITGVLIAGGLLPAQRGTASLTQGTRLWFIGPPGLLVRKGHVLPQALRWPSSDWCVTWKRITLSWDPLGCNYYSNSRIGRVAQVVDRPA